MRKPASVNPWIRHARPYDGGELVVLVHRVTGQRNVLFSNQWGEVSRPMFNSTISRMVAEMLAV